MVSGPTDPEGWFRRRYSMLHNSCARVMMAHADPLLDAAADEVDDDALRGEAAAWVQRAALDLHDRALAGATWPRAGLLVLGDTRRLVANLLGDRPALAGRVPGVAPPRALRRHVNRHIREQVDTLDPEHSPTEIRRWREIDRISRRIQMREGHASRFSIEHIAAVQAALPPGPLFDPYRDELEPLVDLFERHLPRDEIDAAPATGDDGGTTAVDILTAILAPRVAAAFASLPVETQEILVVKLDLERGPCAGMTQADYIRRRDGMTPSRFRTLAAAALEQLRAAFAATGRRGA